MSVVGPFARLNKKGLAPEVSALKLGQVTARSRSGGEVTFRNLDVSWLRCADRSLLYKRLTNIILSFFLICVTAPVSIAALLYVLIITRRNPIFTQLRLGQFEKPFRMYKIKTLRADTPHVPKFEYEMKTLSDVCKFMRRTRIDELPQLWNVLLGDMSIIGPRPCLSVQTDLIRLRRDYGIFRLKPGLTGIGQISNIDRNDVILTAKMDELLLDNSNPLRDVRIILDTFMFLTRKIFG